MFRLMQPADMPTLKKLWSKAFGDGEEQAEAMILRFAGEKNTYVAEEDGAVVGMLLAAPARIGERRGAYLCGITTQQEYRRRGLATGLINFAGEQLAQRGACFAALVPASRELFSFYEKMGFVRGFARRNVQRPIKRNIWSQAEFDSAPAKRLCDLRVKYCPDIVQLSTDAMVQELTELYSRGITVVSAEDGYGLYFREGETLHFVELMAEGDRAAERLMEAAREREVIVDNANVTVNAGQNLFLGEGTREDHGMIRFFGEAFDISESYLGLALDV